MQLTNPEFSPSLMSQGVLSAQQAHAQQQSFIRQQQQNSYHCQDDEMNNRPVNKTILQYKQQISNMRSYLKELEQKKFSMQRRDRRYQPNQNRGHSQQHQMYYQQEGEYDQMNNQQYLQSYHQADMQQDYAQNQGNLIAVHDGSNMPVAQHLVDGHYQPEPTYQQRYQEAQDDIGEIQHMENNVVTDNSQPSVAFEMDGRGRNNSQLSQIHGRSRMSQLSRNSLSRSHSKSPVSALGMNRGSALAHPFQRRSSSKKDSINRASRLRELQRSVECAGPLSNESPVRRASSRKRIERSSALKRSSKKNALDFQACSEIPQQRKVNYSPNCMQQHRGSKNGESGVIKIYHEMNSGRNDKTYFATDNVQSGLREATGNPADNQLNQIMQQIQHLKTENRELRGIIRHDPDVLKGEFGTRQHVIVTSDRARDDSHLSRNSMRSFRSELNRSADGRRMSRSNSLKAHSHGRRHAATNQLYHGDGCNGVINLDSRGLQHMLTTELEGGRVVRVGRKRKSSLLSGGGSTGKKKRVTYSQQKQVLSSRSRNSNLKRRGSGVSKSSMGSSRLDAASSYSAQRSRKTGVSRSAKSKSSGCVSRSKSKNSFKRLADGNRAASFNPLDSVGSPNIFSASRLSKSRSRSRMSGKSNSTSALRKHKVSKTAKREHCKECQQCYLWREKVKSYNRKILNHMTYQQKLSSQNLAAGSTSTGFVSTRPRQNVFRTGTMQGAYDRKRNASPNVVTFSQSRESSLIRPQSHMSQHAYPAHMNSQISRHSSKSRSKSPLPQQAKQFVRTSSNPMDIKITGTGHGPGSLSKSTKSIKRRSRNSASRSRTKSPHRVTSSGKPLKRKKLGGTTCSFGTGLSREFRSRSGSKRKTTASGAARLTGFRDSLTSTMQKSLVGPKVKRQIVKRGKVVTVDAPAKRSVKKKVISRKSSKSKIRTGAVKSVIPNRVRMARQLGPNYTPVPVYQTSHLMNDSPSLNQNLNYSIPSDSRQILYSNQHGIDYDNGISAFGSINRDARNNSQQQSYQDRRPVAIPNAEYYDSQQTYSRESPQFIH